MRKLFPIAFYLFSAVASSNLMAAEIPKEKQAIIDELITISGTNQMAKAMGGAVIKSMIDTMKKSNSGFPERAYTIVHEEVMSIFNEEIDNKSFAQQLYPLYDKYFNTEELRELVKFNFSPLGKKVAAIMPQLAQESVAVGQACGANPLAPKSVSGYTNG